MASLLILGFSGATKKDTATGNVNIKKIFLNPINMVYVMLHSVFIFIYFFNIVLVKNNSGVKPAGQCGTWVKEAEGGLFTSPNHPNKYPPNTECVYILEGKCYHHTH